MSMKYLILVLLLCSCNNNELFNEIASGCVKICKDKGFSGLVEVQPDIVNCVCGSNKWKN